MWFMRSSRTPYLLQVAWSRRPATVMQSSFRKLPLFSFRYQRMSNNAHCAPFPSRSHTCGALTASDAGAHVVLAGSLLPERKVSKSMSFFPIKDSFGTTQLVVFHKKDAPCDLSALSEVPVESSVLIEGYVRLRPEKDQRPEATGKIEVQVEKFLLLNAADREMPFLPSDTQNLANEDLRARYRYLDLRRSVVSDNLRKRSKVAHIIRSSLHEQEFLEVETPILLKSTPEGAREFLVPTRNTGNASYLPKGPPMFFALSQSPQQPKQLLICSGGVDKYFQLARCFRDEDGRKDRQPEFTQVDLEMAYVSWGDNDMSLPSPGPNTWRIGGSEVRSVVECLAQKIWQQLEGITLPESFQVLTYQEAMRRFGSDKPDTRFGLEISDITHTLPSDLRDTLVTSGTTLECLAVRQSDSAFIRAARRLQQDDSTVERITLTEANMSSWLRGSSVVYETRSLLDESQVRDVNDSIQLRVGDVVWLHRRPRTIVGGSTPLGRIRLQLSELAKASGDFTASELPHFLWITEFPLFTRSDNEKDFLAQGRWSSTHHPFTAPMWQDMDAMYNGHFERVRGQHYDLVLNGVEIGGGSVRVHDAAMQDHIFSKILQLSDSEKASFSHLLHALTCGAPPHGGIALGFDRLMAILCKTQTIRDVIAFPKTSAGTDLLFKGPAVINTDTLHQYGIRPR